jgi:hypothetical protein
VKFFDDIEDQAYEEVWECICNFNIFKDDQNLLKKHIELMTFLNEQLFDGKKQNNIYSGLMFFLFYRKNGH